MIRIDLTMFGGRGGSSGGGAGKGSDGSKGSTSTTAPGSGRGGGGRTMDGAPPEPKTRSRVETQEEIEKRITDNRGNVKTIENGQRYNIYSVRKDKTELFSDKLSATDTRDYLEGFRYNSETGRFRDEYGREYVVKLVKKKK